MKEQNFIIDSLSLSLSESLSLFSSFFSTPLLSLSLMLIKASEASKSDTHSVHVRAMNVSSFIRIRRTDLRRRSQEVQSKAKRVMSLFIILPSFSFSSLSIHSLSSSSFHACLVQNKGNRKNEEEREITVSRKNKTLGSRTLFSDP